MTCQLRHFGSLEYLKAISAGGEVHLMRPTIDPYNGVDCSYDHTNAKSPKYLRRFLLTIIHPKHFAFLASSER